MWSFKSKARREAERRLAQTPDTVFPRFVVRAPMPTACTAAGYGEFLRSNALIVHLSGPMGRVIHCNPEG